MRVVLDTNVLLSAVFTRGVCEALLDACVESEEVELITSEYILQEFDRHATGKFGVPEQEARDAVEFMRRLSVVVAPTALAAGVCKDPDDVPVIGTAVADGAAVLVTGDAGLLELKRVGEVAIVSPRMFYDSLR